MPLEQRKGLTVGQPLLTCMTLDLFDRLKPAVSYLMGKIEGEGRKEEGKREELKRGVLAVSVYLSSSILSVPWVLAEMSTYLAL